MSIVKTASGALIISHFFWPIFKSVYPIFEWDNKVFDLPKWQKTENRKLE